MGEADQLKWQGIRPTDPEEIFTRYEPPEGCTYVCAGDNVTLDNVDLYTVPADTIFYLTDWELGIRPGATGYGCIFIYTPVPAVYLRLCCVNSIANVGKVVTGSLNIAIQLPATYFINLLSSAAGVVAEGWIVGYTRSTL